MIVKSLELKQFRNYENLSITFKDKLNFILGKNGEGKTNLVEAIYYLSSARSFRTSDYKELIKEKCDYASIKSVVRIGEEEKIIKLVLTSEGQKVVCNGVEIKKLSELNKILNVIVFEPKDVLLFQSLPKVRRSFLNMQISKRSPAYLEACTLVGKLIKERNAALKEAKPNLLIIETLNERIVENSYLICEKRKEFLKVLEPLVNKILKNITGLSKEITIKYESFIDYKNKEQFIAKAKLAYKDALENDLKYKTTSIGIHHEDFSTRLKSVLISEYGSQGEKRMTAIALKLAPYFMIDNKNKRPIVVLDDVLSELDQGNQDRLVNFLSKFNQVFITGTHINKKYNATIYKVAENKIMEV